MFKLVISLTIALNLSMLAHGQTVDGVLEPVKDVIIKTSIDGIVTNIPILEGNTVENGTLIVAFDDSEQAAKVSLARTIAKATAAVGAAQSRASVAARKYSDLETAKKNNAATLWEVLDAKANKTLASYELAAAKEEAQANLQRLKLEEEILSRYHFKAPFSGVVSEIFVTQGQSVNRGEKIAHLVNTTNLEIESFVDAEYFDLLTQGQSYVAHIPEPFNRTFDVKLIHISPVFDSATGAVRTIFTAKNESNLPVGINTTISLTREPEHFAINSQGE